MALLPFTAVWPSLNPSYISFKEMLKATTFHPASGVSLRGEILEDQATDEFPITTCQACTEKFRSGGILECVEGVKWRMLDTSTYDLKKVVSFTYTPYCVCVCARASPNFSALCIYGIIQTPWCHPCMLFRICHFATFWWKGRSFPVHIPCNPGCFDFAT